MCLATCRLCKILLKIYAFIYHFMSSHVLLQPLRILVLTTFAWLNCFIVSNVSRTPGERQHVSQLAGSMGGQIMAARGWI